MIEDTLAWHNFTSHRNTYFKVSVILLLTLWWSGWHWGRWRPGSGGIWSWTWQTGNTAWNSPHKATEKFKLWQILYRDRSSNGIQLVYVVLYWEELEIGLQWTQWWCEWALETAASVPKWTPPFSRLQKFKLWPLVSPTHPGLQSPRCVKMAGKVAMAALKSKEQALQEELTNFNALRKG